MITLSCSSPLTEVNDVLTLPDATQGSSVPPVVPETLLYLVHGVEGRNVAHVSCGGVVLVEPTIELVGVAEAGELVAFGVGTSVPGPPVLVSPQDVRSTARNKDGTMHCHDHMRFIALPQRMD